MKITLTTTWAGPTGVAKAGTVIDVPNKQAEDLIERRQARAFDAKRDAKAPKGLTTPEKQQ